MMDVEKGRTSPWEEHKWEGVPKIQAYHSLKVIIGGSLHRISLDNSLCMILLTIFWSRQA